jgi:hypothetical protein
MKRTIMATREKITLVDAIADRLDRAEVVRNNYSLEYVGAQAWAVSHPDDPERSYLVDMISRTCTCPDFRSYSNPRLIFCKHLYAVLPIWEEATGKKLPLKNPFLFEYGKDASYYEPGEDPPTAPALGVVLTPPAQDNDPFAD